MANILEEYLVSLGFQVRQNELGEFRRAITELQKVVQGSAAGMTNSFTTASGAIVSAIGAINVATISMMKHVAQADMGYQKFALRMWTSKENAKDLKTVLDTLGESIEDIAYIPELRGQFYQLLGEGRGMRPPDEFGDMMKNFRSIMFEFKRLQLEISYGMEWVTYYLGKYLEEPIAKIKNYLTEFNNYLQNNMAIWTQKVAQILSWFLRLGETIGNVVFDLTRGLYKLWDAFPAGVKIMIGAFAALGAFMLASPVGQFIFIMSMALLLLEDFYTYLEGGESVAELQPMWDTIIEFGKELDEWLKELKSAFLEIEKGAKELGKEIDNLLKIIGIDMSKFDAWKLLAALFNKMKENTMDILYGWTTIMRIIGLAMQGKWSEIGDIFKENLKKLQYGSNKQTGIGPTGDEQSGKTPAWMPTIKKDEKSTGSGWWPFTSSEAVGEGKTWFAKHPESMKGLQEQTVAAIDALSDWWFRETGRQMHVTVGVKGGAHGSGNKFDVADDWTSELLERNEGGIRDRMLAYAQSLGLEYIDEYENPSAYATGGHLDFSAHGFRGVPRNGDVANSSVVNNNTITVNAGAGADATKIADTIVAKLETMQGRASQIKTALTMRAVEGVNA